MCVSTWMYLCTLVLTGRCTLHHCLHLQVQGNKVQITKNYLTIKYFTNYKIISKIIYVHCVAILQFHMYIPEFEQCRSRTQSIVPIPPTSI